MPPLPSGLPEHVADGECLGRFLTQSGQIRAQSQPPVHATAFLPNPKNGETSVMRLADETPAELWRMADQLFTMDRRARGIARLRALDVREAGAEVQAAEPPLRHANIIGWPLTAAGSDPVEQKARQREIATLMAARAELLLRTSTEDGSS